MADDFKAQVRRFFADYVKSEGCFCCQSIDSHKDALEKLALLLDIERYSDGSGYDVYKYATEPLATEAE
jgi:hypothetical protein